MNRQIENCDSSFKEVSEPPCTHPPGGRTITIACYRRPYSRKSLLHIKGLLKLERPARVVILRILEVGEIKEIVDTGLGFGDIQEFEESFANDQKKRTHRYAEAIHEICRNLGIASKEVIRKGHTADVILREAQGSRSCHVVIHESDKTRMDKFLSGCVQDDVKRKALCRLTILK